MKKINPLKTTPPCGMQSFNKTPSKRCTSPFSFLLSPFSLLLFCLSAFLLLPATAQVTNVQTDFSCPGVVTVTYDLKAKCPTEVTLYFSTQRDAAGNLVDSLPVTEITQRTPTVGSFNALTGTLYGQATGSYTITWNCAAQGVSIGKVYVKVVSPANAQPVDMDEYIVTTVTPNLRWATRNVDAPGTFAANPQDRGMFYQSNRNDGWSATIPGSGVAISGNGVGVDRYGNAFSNANWPPAGTDQRDTFWCDDPCPVGWRLPTVFECNRFNFSNSFRITNWNGTGVSGNYTDGRDKDGNAVQLFFPAGGLRAGATGMLNLVNSEGHYWTSSGTTTNGYYLWFTSAPGAGNLVAKTTGCLIRCVQDQ